MTLSTKMLQDFVEALVVKPEPPKESTAYGTMGEDDEVLFDGADEYTPCVPLIVVAVDDRVVITVKDNTAYITGVL